MLYTIAKAKAAIKDGITAYLNKDEAGIYRMKEVNCLPFYLEGAPGIGKTEIVCQIADEMNIGFVSFSMVHHTRNSLLGLPVIKDLENGDKYTSYTMSEVIAKVFESVADGHEEGILLLDEFPCMSESVMPAMLAFLQTKNIGTHTLPRGWVIVLCGNPAKYNKQSRSFDAAVTDRIRKIEIEYSLYDFCAYAEKNNFNSVILSYLDNHPEHIYRFVKAKDKDELVTCRGWENLSHALDLYEELGQSIDVPCVQQFIKSEEIASAFTEYYKQQMCGMTEIERKNIFAGKISKELVNKYSILNFEQKWNTCAYMMGYVNKSAAKVLHTNEVMDISDKLIDVIKSILSDDSGDDYWNVVNTIGSTANILTKSYIDPDVRERDMEYLISEWKSRDCISELNIKDDCLSEILKSWAKVWYEAQNGYSYATLMTDVKEYIKALDSWKKEYKAFCRDYKEQVGKQMDCFFDFLSKIDESGTLQERLYLEISGNHELLKIACDCQSEKYAEMCKKQYGVA